MGLKQEEKTFLSATTSSGIELALARLKEAADEALDEVWGEDGNDVLGEAENVSRATIETLIAQVMDIGAKIAERKIQDEIAQL